MRYGAERKILNIMTNGRRNGWLKSHHWVDVPHTAYERRRELRVRESSQSVLSWDRKYFNIDTGKFNTDKLVTIKSYTLQEMVESDYVSGHDRTPKYFNEDRRWFTPKDDDWDDDESVVKLAPKPIEIIPEPVEVLTIHEYRSTYQQIKFSDEQIEWDRKQKAVDLKAWLEYSEKEHLEDLQRMRENAISKHWVYHPEFEAKIVCGDEYQQHLENGWFDSPVKF